MTADQGHDAALRGTPRGCYFFLSYARTPRTGESNAPDPDGVVSYFYDDLCHAVSVFRNRRDLDIGFCDRALTPGLDPKARALAALGGAEIFVPLYTPRYFTSVAAGRELTAFHARLEAQRVATPERNVIPVLWSPLPPGYQIPYGAPVPNPDLIEEYANNGLHALYRLARYRDSYERVVRLTAALIVRTAQDSPVGPGPLPVIQNTDLLFPRGRSDPPFAIVVATASDAGVPAPEWRPFGGREELPLAEHAAGIAERFGFSAAVSPLGDKTSDPFGNAPGVVLVDTWLADSDAGRRTLDAIARNFPPWAIPLLVAARDPRTTPARAAALAEIAGSMLAQGAPNQGEAARRAAPPVASIEDFERVFPILVTDTARRYLREGPIQAPSGDAEERPRIFRPSADGGPNRAQEEYGG